MPYSTFSVRGPLALPSGPALDPATTAWVNAVNAAAGSSVVGATNKTIVDTLIKALKTDAIGNLFTSNDRLWLLALANESTFEAQVDILNLASWTSHGSFTLDANGFAGDGSSAFLDTGFIPSSAGGNFSVLSSSMSAAVLTNRTTFASNICEMGTNANAGGSPTFIGTDSTADTFYELSGVGPVRSATPTIKGFQLASVTSSGATGAAGYLNGSSLGTSSGAGASVAQDSIYIGALRLGASTIQFCADQIVSAHIGGGMNATQAANFTTIVNAALTSLGKNVF